MDIATGKPEDHPVLQSSTIPATARPTETVGQLTGPTIPARDAVGEYAAQMAAAEADCRAAQSAGMAAETGRRTSYAADMAPLGASYGDEMALPDVPANTVPPASSDLYPWQGDEPVPAG